jgi:uncharacterized membrane protein YhaH (DUF805 family)
MDNIVSLYTSTEGRISRKTWWLAAIGLAVVNLIISMLIFPLIGLGMPNAQAILSAGDAAAVTSLVMGAMQTSGWASLILFLVFAYPIYCISVKRRHDKDNNGMDVIGYLVLTVLMLLVQALGMAFSVTDVGGTPVPMPSMIFSVLGFIALVYAIYMLVVLGFLRGTAGPNQYGPDPLAGGAATAAA